MLANSVEYQLPVMANDSFYLVGFVDSGTVERTVEIRDYRVAAGVGVRFVVPMLGPVPIALDFGFPIVKASFDKEQVFSFWLGFFR
jgi:outer membrane protein insertion porin family